MTKAKNISQQNAAGAGTGISTTTSTITATVWVVVLVLHWLRAEAPEAAGRWCCCVAEHAL
jgi:hypothetical protein